MKSLTFRSKGEIFMLRFPNGYCGGADAALQSWVNNPEVDFTAEDREELQQRLFMIWAAQKLFGP